MRVARQQNQILITKSYLTLQRMRSFYSCNLQLYQSKHLLKLAPTSHAYFYIQRLFQNLKKNVLQSISQLQWFFLDSVGLAMTAYQHILQVFGAGLFLSLLTFFGQLSIMEHFFVLKHFAVNLKRILISRRLNKKDNFVIRASRKSITINQMRDAT